MEPKKSTSKMSAELTVIKAKPAQPKPQEEVKTEPVVAPVVPDSDKKKP